MHRERFVMRLRGDRALLSAAWVWDLGPLAETSSDAHGAQMLSATEAHWCPTPYVLFMVRRKWYSGINSLFGYKIGSVGPRSTENVPDSRPVAFGHRRTHAGLRACIPYRERNGTMYLSERC